VTIALDKCTFAITISQFACAKDCCIWAHLVAALWAGNG